MKRPDHGIHRPHESLNRCLPPAEKCDAAVGYCSTPLHFYLMKLYKLLVRLPLYGGKITLSSYCYSQYEPK